jgi:hypothetical protein
MTSEQQQALAALQVSNDQALAENWGRAANDPAASPADREYAQRQVAAANRRIERATDNG